jgi:hypothetical protein
MIAGAQPKVLLTQNENGDLELDPAFAELTSLLPETSYKLVRERDGLTKHSQDVMWLEFDDNGKFKSKHEEIAVNRSLIMSPFNDFFTWQTTPVTEIITQKDFYIKFKTENSLYELFVLSK